jgi:hypothetical protein
MRCVPPGCGDPAGAQACVGAASAVAGATSRKGAMELLLFPPGIAAAGQRPAPTPGTVSPWHPARDGNPSSRAPRGVLIEINAARPGLIYGSIG